MIAHLASGLVEVFQFSNIIAILAGVVVGYFIGAMPGLTPSIGIALLVPVTYGMDPVTSILLLTSLYMAAEYGGGITAILLNAPGTPAAVATSFDGYQMTQQGEAGKALSISIISSAIGAFTSAVLLILTAVPMASFALTFGPTEYFALALFGLSLISTLSRGTSLIKAILSMLLGLLVVTIGLDSFTGTPRFAFTVQLQEGIPFLPALIGLFALSEVFYMLENAKEKQIETKFVKGAGAPLSLLKKIWLTLLRAPLIGYIIGVVPGAGTTIASLISYSEAKRASKDSDSFGKGNPEGIAASEGANNAAVSGSFAPLFALGIPGSASAAIMIGAMTLQGLQPGPLLFTQNPEIPYSVFATLLVSVPIMLFVGLWGVRLWVNVVRIPKKILAVIVSGICILGSYAYSNSMYPVIVMTVFGLIGYWLRKVNIPTTPMVLALVLGPIMETNFRRALTVSQGDYAFFLSRPITVILLVLSVATLIIPLVQHVMERKKRAKQDGTFFDS